MVGDYETFELDIHQLVKLPSAGLAQVQSGLM